MTAKPGARTEPPRRKVPLSLLLCILPIPFLPADPAGAATDNEHRKPAVPACLVLSRPDGGRVFTADLEADESFILRYKHSVHQSPVSEYFGACAEGDGIAVLEGRYEDYGAGLPQKAEAGQRLEFDSGRARLIVSTGCLPEIELRVGRLAEHTLIVKRHETRLAELSDPGTVLLFRVQKGRCSGATTFAP
ncbi:MAG: DUF1850 domain-containing protein [Desulfovibrio sp.]|nr:DUF1850 domain-containing protein [Desulfovibrio sp.]